MSLFTGGTRRVDVPVGFYEKLGISVNDLPAQHNFAPWKKILLRVPAKESMASRMARTDRDAISLEALCEDFCDLLNNSTRLTVKDVQSTMSE